MPSSTRLLPPSSFSPRNNVPLHEIGEIAQYLDHLESLDNSSLRELLRLAEALEKIENRDRNRTEFLPFVKSVWPSFVEGYHHKVVARLFEDIAAGRKKRLIICMPPRHTKSEFASYLFPAWFIGQYPHKKIIQATHTGELSVNFGRKVRDLIGTKEYCETFPGVALKADTKAAGRWNTSANGEYWSVGVGAALAGKGADLFVIDDPHSEQDGMATDQKAFEKAYDWYTSGPRQRLQPGAAIVIVMTRWNKGDLVGRILKKAAEEGDDEWDLVELPAILPSGKPIWPEFWPVEELLKIKRDIPPHKWSAQYLQEPTGGGGTIIKPDWWRRWPDKTPPKVTYVIQSWDTAFSKSTKNDFSAVTTWGVFTHPDERGRPGTNIILLDAKKRRLEFPDLKAMAKEEWKQWNPDTLIVEGRLAGMPLIQELRSMGIPVQSYNPPSGQDKIARVNSIADLFASGVIWVPERQFAEELIEEFSDFPAGIHDDLVDSATQALMRFRQGGFIRLASDDNWDTEEFEQPVARYY